jgi:hypothetical protein
VTIHTIENLIVVLFVQLSLLSILRQEKIRETREDTGPYVALVDRPCGSR